MSELDDVGSPRPGLARSVPPGAFATLAVVAIGLSWALGALRHEMVAWRVVGWILAGLGATSAVSLYGRAHLATGRRPLVWLIVVLNVVALAIAIWHAAFVTRRIL